MKEQLRIRFSEVEDRKYLENWLSDANVLRWFPMENKREVDDAINIIMSYVPYKAVLTALWDDVPCGLANLYLQPYRKLAHQCLFAIIVSKEERGKGIGTALLRDLIILAKERFSIELLHLEVYDENPAISLYERMGFERYGYHPRFTKDDGQYRGKILMQKFL